MIDQFSDFFMSLQISTRVLLVVVIFGFLFSLCVAFILALTDPRRSIARTQRDSNKKRVWGIYATGGGNFDTEPCTRQQAIDIASKLGSVCFIDDINHFVFYRPRV